MVRKRFLLITAVVVAVGIAAATLSLQTILRTEANAGDATMELTATGTGVTCDGDTCTVPVNGPFSLNVGVVNFPDGGYTAMSFDLDWTGTGLTKKPPDCSAIADEIVWPDNQGLNTCAQLAGEETTHFQGGDISSNLGTTLSEFKGSIVVYSMNCTAGDSTNVIELLPWEPNDNPLGSELADSLGEILPTSDSLTINCGAGAVQATATPTTGQATATVEGPTNTPAPPTATTEPGGPTNTPAPPTSTPPVTAATATRTNTPVVLSTPTPIPSLGDANGDGVVDSGDAQLVLQYEAGLADSGDLDLDAADVNRDGEVNSVDALFILWADAGMISL